MPLSMLLEQQLVNPYGCPVITMSMRAQMTGSSAESAEIVSSKGALSMAEATSGKFRALFMQPEAAMTEAGQKLLREMSNKDLIRCLVVDEVHQVQIHVDAF